MKKIALLLFLCVFAATQIFVPCHSVKAEEHTYARILEEKVGFYSDSGGLYLKFFIPYSYYVKVLEKGDIFTRVSYMNSGGNYPYLEGYVRTSSLTFSELTPVSPYPEVSLTTLYDGVMFYDYSLSRAILSVYQGKNVRFYGEVVGSNGTLFYVYEGGNLGYMKKECFSDFVLPNHPDPIAREETPPVTSPSSSIEEEAIKPLSSALQTAIIVAVAVIALIIIYILFKPAKRENYRGYDESDY